METFNERLRRIGFYAAEDLKCNDKSWALAGTCRVPPHRVAGIRGYLRIHGLRSLAGGVPMGLLLLLMTDAIIALATGLSGKQISRSS